MRMILVAIFCALSALPARAEGPDQALAGLEERGRVNFEVFGRPFFRAKLLTPDAAALDWQEPLALELFYQRTFFKPLLVWSTMVEFDRMEGAQDDHVSIRSDLGKCFKTVRAGDTYIAYAETPDRVVFWLNDELTCRLEAEDISRRFLSIWLSDQARDPGQSQVLRGDISG